MYHHFNVEIAKKYGLDEAILLDYYLSCRNSLKIEPTIPELIKFFPYWKPSHILELVNRLLELKLI